MTYVRGVVFADVDDIIVALNQRRHDRPAFVSIVQILYAYLIVVSHRTNGLACIVVFSTVAGGAARLYAY